MNAPDRYERFVLPEGVKKVTREVDTKVRHAATFIVEREDHTVGNLVRMQLHRDPEVIFAGYKVQTKGAVEPPGALQQALRELDMELDSIGEQFQRAANDHLRQRMPSY